MGHVLWWKRHQPQPVTQQLDFTPGDERGGLLHTAEQQGRFESIRQVVFVWEQTQAEGAAGDNF